jgi:hypothetical protein
VPGYPGYGYGYCDPWSYAYNCGGYGGYGGYGGFGSYGGYYDPWYGGGFSVSPQTSYSSSGDDGSLRLKIKPNNAEVYVDGYYVGLVDEFDGLFQRLHIESGAHRVEVRGQSATPEVVSPGTRRAGEMKADSEADYCGVPASR